MGITLSGSGSSSSSSTTVPTGIVPVTGQYVMQMAHAGLTTAALAVNEQLVLCPLPIGASVTLDRIGIDITVAGNAGSVVRLGLFSWTASSPDTVTLVVDAGTVDGTATGFNPITISQAVTPGMYFTGVCPQNSATTRPTCRTYQNSSTPFSFHLGSTGGAATGRFGLRKDTVPGAFAASYSTLNPSTVSTVAAVWVRAA